MKLLFKNIDIPGIKHIDTYVKHGGYESLKKALKMEPDAITEEVKKSGLRGRGGAGFPTGLKWSFLAKPEGVPRHLVCNADESEPGTFKDRYLMEHIPHLLIEGLLISSFALGSNATYIYIRGEFAWIVDILENAIEEARAKNFLGKNILGTGFDCEIYVQRGAGAYICGEETALLESRSEEHTSELQSRGHLVCFDSHSFPTRRSSDLGFKCYLYLYKRRICMDS